jgi:hypothetical protein
MCSISQDPSTFEHVEDHGEQGDDVHDEGKGPTRFSDDPRPD